MCAGLCVSTSACIKATLFRLLLPLQGPSLPCPAESFRVRDLSLPSVDYEHDPLLPGGASPEPTIHGAPPSPPRPRGGAGEGGGGTPEGSAHGGGGSSAAAAAEVLATPLLGRSPMLEPIGEDDDLPASTRVLIWHNQQQQGGGGRGGSGGQWGGRAPPLGQAYARNASMGPGRSRRSSDGGGERSWATVLWRRMERPCLALLSVFMPRVGGGRRESARRAAGDRFWVLLNCCKVRLPGIPGRALHRCRCPCRG